MAIRLLVLYPHPTDKDQFEARYLSKHVPLMRGERVTTYRTIDTPEGQAPYYRGADIYFRDAQHFGEFMQSEKARIAVESAHSVSTGGKPLFILCGEPDPRPEGVLP